MFFTAEYTKGFLCRIAKEALVYDARANAQI
jgi:hypothetical protein